MNRIPVRSSNIRSIGYDEENLVLEIEFLDHALYEYYAVPPDVHAGLMSARSHGVYFHSHVEGRYKYNRLA